MNHSNHHKIGAQGFTLVEVLLAIAISGLVIAALYSFYLMQKKTGETQQGVAVMQQDLRGLMQTMAQDIRMAGYAPVDASHFGFQDVTVGSLPFYRNNGGGPDDAFTDAAHIAFTSDMNDVAFTGNPADKSNGEVDYAPDQNQQEQFAYRFRQQGVPCGDGAPRPRGCVQRYLPNTAAGWQNIAVDIDGLDFLYTLRNGNKTPDPAATNDLRNIVSVTVTILTKSPNREPGYKNRECYRSAGFYDSNPNPAPCPTDFNGGNPTNNPPPFNNGNPYNDNIHRQMLTFTVECRNQR